MTNPVVVEAYRGSLIESRHRGAVAVVDTQGRSMFALGDVERPVYPRSAIKALQALTLVESGAADRFGLQDEHLAIACASHNGEPDHVATVVRMLACAGLDGSALQCGAHWPLHEASARALARAGDAPGALHNNCSGKHAGFLCAAGAMGIDHRSYFRLTDPVQRAVKATIEGLTGKSLSDEHAAVDGCSVPTWALPLSDLALAFARFGSGHAIPAARAKAAARLRAACSSRPWHVAGTGRFCTEIMQSFGARVFVKVGAEGVFCAALPAEGLGIAVKCDDGAGRAAEIIIAAMIDRFLKGCETARNSLQQHLRPTLRNWNGMTVGELRPAASIGAY
jgi:L-asparaginase II